MEPIKIKTVSGEVVVFDINEICDHLVGLPENMACSIIELYKFKVRVTKRNGKANICTRDFSNNRVNIEIVDGKITSAHVG